MRSIKEWIRKPIAALAAVATISGALVAAPVAQAGDGSITWFTLPPNNNDNPLSDYRYSGQSVRLAPNGTQSAKLTKLGSSLNIALGSGEDLYTPQGVKVDLSVSGMSDSDVSSQYKYAFCAIDALDETADNADTRLINDLRKVAYGRANGPVSNFDLQQLGNDGKATLRVPTGLVYENSQEGYDSTVACYAFKSDVLLTKSSLDRINFKNVLTEKTLSLGEFPTYPAGNVLDVDGPVTVENQSHLVVTLKESLEDVYVVIDSARPVKLSTYPMDQDGKYLIPAGLGHRVSFYISLGESSPFVLLDTIELRSNAPQITSKYKSGWWANGNVIFDWSVASDSREDYVTCKAGDDGQSTAIANSTQLIGSYSSAIPMTCWYGNTDVQNAPVHYASDATVTELSELFSLASVNYGTAGGQDYVTVTVKADPHGANVGNADQASAKYSVRVSDAQQAIISENITPDVWGDAAFPSTTAVQNDFKVSLPAGKILQHYKSPLNIQLIRVSDSKVIQEQNLEIPQNVEGSVSLGSVKWVNGSKTALSKPTVMLNTVPDAQSSHNNIATAKIAASDDKPTDDPSGTQEVAFADGAWTGELNYTLANAISAGTKIWIKPYANSISPGEWTELTGFLKKPTATIASQGRDAVVSGTDALRCSIDGAAWSDVTSGNRVLTGAAGKSVICQQFNDPIESPAITTSVTAALPAISSVAIKRIGGTVTVTPTASAELSSGQNFYYGGIKGESSHIITSDDASTLEIKVKDGSGNAGAAVTVNIPAKLAAPVLSKVTYPLTGNVTLGGTGVTGSNVVVAKDTVTPAATAPEGAQTSAAIADGTTAWSVSVVNTFVPSGQALTLWQVQSGSSTSDGTTITTTNVGDAGSATVAAAPEFVVTTLYSGDVQVSKSSSAGAEVALFCSVARGTVSDSAQTTPFTLDNAADKNVSCQTRNGDVQSAWTDKSAVAVVANPLTAAYGVNGSGKIDFTATGSQDLNVYLVYTDADDKEKQLQLTGSDGSYTGFLASGTYSGTSFKVIVKDASGNESAANDVTVKDKLSDTATASVSSLTRGTSVVVSGSTSDTAADKIGFAVADTDTITSSGFTSLGTVAKGSNLTVTDTSNLVAGKYLFARSVELSTNQYGAWSAGKLIPNPVVSVVIATSGDNAWTVTPSFGTESAAKTAGSELQCKVDEVTGWEPVTGSTWAIEGSDKADKTVTCRTVLNGVESVWVTSTSNTSDQAAAPSDVKYDAETGVVSLPATAVPTNGKVVINGADRDVTCANNVCTVTLNPKPSDRFTVAVKDANGSISAAATITIPAAVSGVTVTSAAGQDNNTVTTVSGSAPAGTVVEIKNGQTTTYVTAGDDNKFTATLNNATGDVVITPVSGVRADGTAKPGENVVRGTATTVATVAAASDVALVTDADSTTVSGTVAKDQVVKITAGGTDYYVKADGVGKFSTDIPVTSGNITVTPVTGVDENGAPIANAAQSSGVPVTKTVASTPTGVSYDANTNKVTIACTDARSKVVIGEDEYPLTKNADNTCTTTDEISSAPAAGSTLVVAVKDAADSTSAPVSVAVPAAVRDVHAATTGSTTTISGSASKGTVIKIEYGNGNVAYVTAGNGGAFTKDLTNAAAPIKVTPLSGATAEGTAEAGNQISYGTTTTISGLPTAPSATLNGNTLTVPAGATVTKGDNQLTGTDGRYDVSGQPAGSLLTVTTTDASGNKASTEVLLPLKQPTLSANASDNSKTDLSVPAGDAKEVLVTYTDSNGTLHKDEQAPIVDGTAKLTGLDIAPGTEVSVVGKAGTATSTATKLVTAPQVTAYTSPNANSKTSGSVTVKAPATATVTVQYKDAAGVDQSANVSNSNGTFTATIPATAKPGSTVTITATVGEVTSAPVKKLVDSADAQLPVFDSNKAAKIAVTANNVMVTGTPYAPVTISYAGASTPITGVLDSKGEFSKAINFAPGVLVTATVKTKEANGAPKIETVKTVVPPAAPSVTPVADSDNSTVAGSFGNATAVEITYTDLNGTEHTKTVTKSGSETGYSVVYPVKPGTSVSVKAVNGEVKSEPVTADGPSLPAQDTEHPATVDVTKDKVTVTGKKGAGVQVTIGNNPAVTVTSTIGNSGTAEVTVPTGTAPGTKVTTVVSYAAGVSETVVKYTPIDTPRVANTNGNTTVSGDAGDAKYVAVTYTPVGQTKEKTQYVTVTSTDGSYSVDNLQVAPGTQIKVAPANENGTALAGAETAVNAPAPVKTHDASATLSATTLQLTDGTIAAPVKITVGDSSTPITGMLDATGALTHTFDPALAAGTKVVAEVTTAAGTHTITQYSPLDVPTVTKDQNGQVTISGAVGSAPNVKVTYVDPKTGNTVPVEPVTITNSKYSVSSSSIPAGVALTVTPVDSEDHAVGAATTSLPLSKQEPDVTVADGKVTVTGTPGATVTVKVGGQELPATIDENGKAVVALPEGTAPGTKVETVVNTAEGSKTITKFAPLTPTVTDNGNGTITVSGDAKDAEKVRVTYTDASGQQVSEDLVVSSDTYSKQLAVMPGTSVTVVALDGSNNPASADAKVDGLPVPAHSKDASVTVVDGVVKVTDGTPFAPVEVTIGDAPNTTVIKGVLDADGNFTAQPASIPDGAKVVTKVTTTGTNGGTQTVTKYAALEQPSFTTNNGLTTVSVAAGAAEKAQVSYVDASGVTQTVLVDRNDEGNFVTEALSVKPGTEVSVVTVDGAGNPLSVASSATAPAAVNWSAEAKAVVGYSSVEVSGTPGATVAVKVGDQVVMAVLDSTTGKATVALPTPIPAGGTLVETTIFTTKDGEPKEEKLPSLTPVAAPSLRVNSKGTGTTVTGSFGNAETVKVTYVDSATGNRVTQIVKKEAGQSTYTIADLPIKPGTNVEVVGTAQVDGKEVSSKPVTGKAVEIPAWSKEAKAEATANQLQVSGTAGAPVTVTVGSDVYGAVLDNYGNATVALPASVEPGTKITTEVDTKAGTEPKTETITTLTPLAEPKVTTTAGKTTISGNAGKATSVKITYTGVDGKQHDEVIKNIGSDGTYSIENLQVLPGSEVKVVGQLDGKDASVETTVKADAAPSFTNAATVTVGSDKVSIKGGTPGAVVAVKVGGQTVTTALDASGNATVTYPGITAPKDGTKVETTIFTTGSDGKLKEEKSAALTPLDDATTTASATKPQTVVSGSFGDAAVVTISYTDTAGVKQTKQATKKADGTFSEDLPVMPGTKITLVASSGTGDSKITSAAVEKDAVAQPTKSKDAAAVVTADGKVEVSGTPGAPVTVKVGSTTVEAVIGADGKAVVALPDGATVPAGSKVEVAVKTANDVTENVTALAPVAKPTVTKDSQDPTKFVVAGSFGDADEVVIEYTDVNGKPASVTLTKDQFKDGKYTVTLPIKPGTPFTVTGKAGSVTAPATEVPASALPEKTKDAAAVVTADGKVEVSGTPGAPVTVKVGETTVEAVIGADGKATVALPDGVAVPAGSKVEATVVTAAGPEAVTALAPVDKPTVTKDAQDPTKSVVSGSFGDAEQVEIAYTDFAGKPQTVTLKKTDFADGKYTVTLPIKPGTSFTVTGKAGSVTAPATEVPASALPDKTAGAAAKVVDGKVEVSGTPGAPVTVKVGSTTVQAVIGADGKATVALPNGATVPAGSKVEVAVATASGVESVSALAPVAVPTVTKDQADPTKSVVSGSFGDADQVTIEYTDFAGNPQQVTLKKANFADGKYTATLPVKPGTKVTVTGSATVGGKQIVAPAVTAGAGEVPAHTADAAATVKDGRVEVTGTPGAPVEVKVGETTVKTVIGADGKAVVTIPGGVPAGQLAHVAVTTKDGVENIAALAAVAEPQLSTTAGVTTISGNAGDADQVEVIYTGIDGAEHTETVPVTGGKYSLADLQLLPGSELKVVGKNTSTGAVAPATTVSVPAGPAFTTAATAAIKDGSLQLAGTPGATAVITIGDEVTQVTLPGSLPLPADLKPGTKITTAVYTTDADGKPHVETVTTFTALAQPVVDMQKDGTAIVIGDAGDAQKVLIRYIDKDGQPQEVVVLRGADGRFISDALPIKLGSSVEVVALDDQDHVASAPATVLVENMDQPTVETEEHAVAVETIPNADVTVQYGDNATDVVNEKSDASGNVTVKLPETVLPGTKLITTVTRGGTKITTVGLTPLAPPLVSANGTKDVVTGNAGQATKVIISFPDPTAANGIQEVEKTVVNGTYTMDDLDIAPGVPVKVRGLVDGMTEPSEGKAMLTPASIEEVTAPTAAAAGLVMGHTGANTKVVVSYQNSDGVMIPVTAIVNADGTYSAEIPAGAMTTGKYTVQVFPLSGEADILASVPVEGQFTATETEPTPTPEPEVPVVTPTPAAPTRNMAACVATSATVPGKMLGAVLGMMATLGLLAWVEENVELPDLVGDALRSLPPLDFGSQLAALPPVQLPSGQQISWAKIAPVGIAAGILVLFGYSVANCAEEPAE